MYVSKFVAKSPIFVVSKVFGLVPFTPKNLSFGITVYDILYTIFCFAIYLCSFLYAVIVNPLNTKKHFPVICSVGHFMHVYFGLFQIVLNFAMCLSKGKCLHTFFTQLKTLDNNLFEIIKRENVNIEKSANFQRVLVATGGIIFSFVTIFDYFVYNEFYGYTTFVVSFSYILPYINASIVQAQFIAIIYAIVIRFQEINSLLNYIATVHETTSNAVRMYKGIDEVPVLNVNTVTPIISMSDIQNNRINYKKSTITSSSSSASTSSPSSNKQRDLENKMKSQMDETTQNNKKETIPKDIHKDMEHLFNLHDQLLDMSELVNSFYCIQIVIYITISFVIILFGFFFETKVVFWLWGQNSELILIATSYVTWGILTAIVIYTVLTICTKAREEAYESALIVHKILQNKPHFMINDEIYYNKMKSFTLQILHRKNTFNFNGLGLFNLDYTFIFSAVSAATSYLIVLLQFDLSSDLLADSE